MPGETFSTNFSIYSKSLFVHFGAPIIFKTLKNSLPSVSFGRYPLVSEIN